MDKKVFSSSSAMKENMEKVKFSLKDQIGMNGHQQNNIVRYLPNIRINGVETNLRGNRVPSWDESSQEKNIPLNSSQINPPSFAPSAFPSASPTNILIQGEMNIFFSIWFGKQEYTNSELVKEKNVLLNLKPSKIIRLPVFTYTPFDSHKIVMDFKESFDDLRGILEHILCRGTEFQIIENHVTKRNICDRMDEPSRPQVQAHMRGDRGTVITRSIDGTIETYTKPQLKSTIILSNDNDILFDLKDDFDVDNGLTWTQFRVTFPVLSVGSIYDEMRREENDLKKLENYVGPATNSITQVEKIANMVVENSIMDGEFEHMFRRSLKRIDKGNLVAVASPLGKENSLFMEHLQNITKPLERKGAYPHQLETTYYSIRQIIGASLIVGTCIFSFALMRIATIRQKKRKKTEKWDSVNHAEDGLLRSHTGLDYILNLNVKKNLETLEEVAADTSSSEVTGSKKSTMLPGGIAIYDKTSDNHENTRMSTI